MSANQQRWMGGIILLGGSALLASFLFQGNGQKSTPPQPTATVDKTLNLDPTHRLSAPTRPVDDSDNGGISNQSVASGGDQTPLAVDVDTERKLLAAQHAMREKNVEEQEAKTAEFLARQQQAEADSARGVAAEQAARLAAKQARDQARDNALSSTDPATPDANIAAGDSPVQAAVAKRRQADQKQVEQSQLRVQKLDAVNHSDADQLARAVARTAKAKSDLEAAEKAQDQIDRDRHLQVMKDHQKKLAKEKLEKLQKEKQQKLEKLRKEKQAKLDAATAKLNAEKAAKQKILQAEKAERERLRDEKDSDNASSTNPAKTNDAKKAALQAEVAKNKKEVAILQAKLDKLNAVNADAVKKDKSTAQDGQKAKDIARARALLSDDDASTAPSATTSTTTPHTLVMIQVAMAESQAKADSMVAQLRAKGYKVRTSSTNKGVRVLVGPEKDAAAASATKHKLEQDGSLNVKGAWVSNWQPPTS